MSNFAVFIKIISAHSIIGLINNSDSPNFSLKVNTGLTILLASALRFLISAQFVLQCEEVESEVFCF